MEKLSPQVHRPNYQEDEGKSRKQPFPYQTPGPQLLLRKDKTRESNAEEPLEHGCIPKKPDLFVVHSPPEKTLSKNENLRYRKKDTLSMIFCPFSLKQGSFHGSVENMETEIPKTYTASDWEQKLYRKWEESGFFNPDNLPGERTEAFSIVMPPPNANGRLHAGHALFVTIEDIFTRYKRMDGKRALWIPGADHAGIETWVVYEKKLEKEGRSRFDMSNEALYKEIYHFTMENKKFMESDLRRLGASCDWSRNAFTLDPKIVAVVQETFRTMFRDGLVYRGNRIVNWCPKHQTGLSDVETENKEETGKLYYFKYGPFDIATVRPETKFGDKYVVMHPDDPRYTKYTHGEKLTVEWINGPIEATIIKDPIMDMAFGTGVMTITPWHSAIDYDLAMKYRLPYEQIIDEQGKLLPIAAEFSGMAIEEAREKIVEKLKAKGLLVKIDEPYEHVKKVCFKCGTTIEPQARDQWFVKMKPLAELALKAVRDNKEITFHPKNYEKIFTYWMENTIDWNISRQIIWGIPIPAQHCSSCNKGFIESEEGDICDCGGEIVAETDTFDTWFSSGQWPLLVLGYPNGKDVATYHPTTIMETGHDLIFKWIPRMIIFSLYLKKEVPFRHVYLHGLVNDEHGQKMSKSKGNVISPIELCDEYGTDALRMALITGNAPGNNIPLSFKKVEAFRNFANKLWNIGRYVATASEKEHLQWSVTLPGNAPLSPADQWILSRLMTTKDDVTRHLEQFNISLAAETLRDFTWNEYADWYVEIHKIEKNDAVLVAVWNELLKLWHPFMPFVTEALFQSLYPQEKTLLMIAPWSTKTFTETKLDDSFQTIIDLIKRIRNMRAIYHVDPKEKPWLTLVGEKTFWDPFLVLIKRLARIEEIVVINDAIQPKETASIMSGDIHAFIHLGGLIDIAKERTRLMTEKESAERYLLGIEKRLNDTTFITKAPAHILEQNRASLLETSKKITELSKYLDDLAL
jgi:valyl-tRNA synthetase